MSYADIVSTGAFALAAWSLWKGRGTSRHEKAVQRFKPMINGDLSSTIWDLRDDGYKAAEIERAWTEACLATGHGKSFAVQRIRQFERALRGQRA